MSARDDLYHECMSEFPGLPSWAEEVISAYRAEVLREAIAAVEDQEQRKGVGWEDARDVLRRMADEAAATLQDAPDET